MALIDQAATATDDADLILLANVETIRDQQQPATPRAVASLIGGAPVREVARRMYVLARLGCLEDRGTFYCLSELGAELLRRELIGWSPSNREERRRESELLARSLFRI